MAKKDQKKEEEKAGALQQKYMEMQMYDQQLKQIQQQAQAVEQQAVEIDYVIQCLDDITKVDPDTEILVPLSSGIFLKAKIVDTKNAMVNVGGGATVKKPLPEVQEMLKTQMKEMRKVQEDLAKNMQDLTRKAAQIESEVRNLSGM
jgi:prefoldin alpha subunit